MAFTYVDRFSQPTRDALKVLEDDLVDFAARMTHLLSVLQELDRVRREKAFLVYHEPVYQMLRSERDMLVIDLDSWALHLHEKGGGGLLSMLSGQDLDALQLEWTGGYPPTISVDGAEHPEIHEHLLAINRAWRRKAFDRLFPLGTHGTQAGVPTSDDVEGYRARLAKRFGPLHSDRNQHRAHRYQPGAKTNKLRSALDLEGLTKHLHICQEVLSDLRCLSSNSQFDSYGYKPKARENSREAQDVVDLVLCGTISWIVEHDPSTEHRPEDRYYWQRREAHYERLHAAHEAADDPSKPFNDRSRLGLPKGRG